MKRSLLHVFLLITLMHSTSFASELISEKKPSLGSRIPATCSELCLTANTSKQKIKDLIERNGLQPNILDKASYEKQTEVVFLAVQEVHHFVQNYRRQIEDPLRSEEALSALVSIWLEAIEFDPHHAIAIRNAEVLDPHFDKLQNHLNAQLKKKAKSPSRQDLINLRIAIAIAESEWSGDGKVGK